MNLRISRVVTAKTVLFASLFCVLVPEAVSASPAQKRLRSNIDDSETFVLKGNTRPVVSSVLAQDVGTVPPSQMMPRMSLYFTRTAAEEADLTQLLKDQQNRRSAQYRKFLTPEQFADRFGLNTADIAKITTWLENNGFSAIEAARSRTAIMFSGTVAQAQSAFHTSIRAYTVNGQSHFANAADPQLPKALQGIVESVRGLHDFLPKPQFTSSSGTSYLVPDDWETIYDVKPLYSAGLDGSPIGGETYSIAVVGQSDVQLSDLHAFRTAAGLAINDPVVVIPTGDTDPGLKSASGDQGESDLDLEWAGAIAKNAKIVFVTGNTVQDAIAYVIYNNLAPILSTSYGQCEQNIAAAEFNSENALFQQAAAQGIVIVASSGDSGAAACDTGSVATKGLAVYFPASSPYVTAIGGTEFNLGRTTNYFGSSNNAAGGSAVSYIPEIAWNDGNSAATGGGASALISKPSWQTGTGVPNDGQRDVPDLAFAASITNTGLIFCNNGSCANGFLNSSSSPAVTGGTSAGPPAFAGVLALLAQKYGSRIPSPLNPNLYSLASISGNAFHDVTAGNNMVVCQGGSTNCPTTTATATGEIGYTAGVGYDQTTGLGSIDSYNFVEQWFGDIQLTASPASVSLPPGTSPVTATVNVSVAPVNNFSGPVSFSCAVSSSISNVISCSVPSTTVNTSGSTTVTITATNPASTLVPQRRSPNFPPLNPAWLLLGLMLSVLLYTFRKYQFLTARSLSTYAAAGLLILTLGAVSCGSGSSTGNAISLVCTLPEALVAVPYNGGNCVASGGKAPYTYGIETNANGGLGPLPVGLTLNTSTGTITGTPTTQGAVSFTLTVSDSGGTTPITSAQSITVGPPPVENGYVTVTATSGSIVNTTKILVTTSL